MATPWMAGKETLHCHTSAFPGAVFLNSFQAVCRAGRRIAALSPEKRGYECLVKTYKPGKEYGEQLIDTTKVKR